MKIAFFPYQDPKNPPEVSNPYIANMLDAIESAYPGCEIIDMPYWRDWDAYKSLDCLWLNWYENLPVEKGIFFFKSILRARRPYLSRRSHFDTQQFPTLSR